MKLNWGVSIAIFYAAFMVVMIIMVVRSSRNTVDLVQQNYYDKDLNYEAFRKSRQNAQLIGEDLKVKYLRSQEFIQISFPASMRDIEGEVTMYRPSDKKEDKRFEIFADEQNAMQITTKGLSSGLWRLFIAWDHDGKSYYKEQRITL